MFLYAVRDGVRYPPKAEENFTACAANQGRVFFTRKEKHKRRSAMCTTEAAHGRSEEPPRNLNWSQR